MTRSRSGMDSDTHPNIYTEACPVVQSSVSICVFVVTSRKGKEKEKERKRKRWNFEANRSFLFSVSLSPFLMLRVVFSLVVVSSCSFSLFLFRTSTQKNHKESKDEPIWNFLLLNLRTVVTLPFVCVFLAFFSFSSSSSSFLLLQKVTVLSIELWLFFHYFFLF